MSIAYITLCGSAKFIDEIHVLAKKLREAGYITTDLKDVPYPKTYDPKEKIQNKYFYTDQIKHSDLLLIYNKNGYIGLSTAMEIQVGIDNNIPIEFLFKTDIIEINALLESEYIIYFNNYFNIKEWVK